MPDTTGRRRPERTEAGVGDPVALRVRDARAGLTLLLQEAAEARRLRAEAAAAAGDGGAVCAWNHFENIPTFYNWNNRPR
ncbi:multiple cyclophane-containing RiPP AmcA [Micromonospora sp. HM5-17]|jgi:hypothetical protein|uniref:multiple cyclophane-containing RiPP AmcA n=1 Tax=Micromonospora sp. HM5-17 TaxID=2487710 RepID=UPI000F499989|nr:multiple cyclophane-containing RiPP AmcA [Micromonospora sp. HM5-17]ROT33782.1 hypothetical protein EF879_02380 [Micromonospora sp. HM5-17]